MRVPLRLFTRLQAVLYIVLAIYLFQLVASGELYRYVGIRAGWILMPAAIILVLLATSLDNRHTAADDREHEEGSVRSMEYRNVWPLVALMIPVLLAAALPGHGQESGAAEITGMHYSLAAPADYRRDNLPDSERTILDWAYLIDVGDLDLVIGHRAVIEGFVYSDPELTASYYVVARYAVTCCLPDATAVGIVIDSAGTAVMPSGGWIRVAGVFAEGTIEGRTFPVLVPDAITPVLDDNQPYLYP